MVIPTWKERSTAVVFARIKGILMTGMQLIISSAGGFHLFHIGRQPRVASALPYGASP